LAQSFCCCFQMQNTNAFQGSKLPMFSSDDEEVVIQPRQRRSTRKAKGKVGTQVDPFLLSVPPSFVFFLQFPSRPSGKISIAHLGEADSIATRELPAALAVLECSVGLCF
jgi:hypothetical protein